MGVLTIELSNTSAATVRMARGLSAGSLRLVHYAVKTAAAQELIRVDIDWLSGASNVLNASNGTSGADDHHLVLPMADDTDIASSLGDGISFTPSNSVVPAVYTVRCYDAAGAALVVNRLVLHFVHEDGTPI